MHVMPTVLGSFRQFSSQISLTAHYCTTSTLGVDFPGDCKHELIEANISKLAIFVHVILCDSPVLCQVLLMTGFLSNTEDYKPNKAEVKESCHLYMCSEQLVSLCFVNIYFWEELIISLFTCIGFSSHTLLT